jgi:hypothetical protein
MALEEGEEIEQIVQESDGASRPRGLAVSACLTLECTHTHTSSAALTAT